jgi:tRNA (guanine-N7-)-methyltransferase
MGQRTKLKHFAQMKKWSHVIEAAGLYKDSDAAEREEYLKLPGLWKSHDFDFVEDGESGLRVLKKVKREKAYDRLILELACGKGFYTLELARRYPNALVVGVDIKGCRIWHGAEESLREGLDNARFFRTRIEALNEYFADGEVDEIWVTFPDPHLREGKAKKRLTSSRFLNVYERILKDAIEGVVAVGGGLLNLKTDNTPLFEFSIETAKEEGWPIVTRIDDVYEDDEAVEKWEGRVSDNSLGGSSDNNIVANSRKGLLHVKTDYEEIFAAKGERIKYLCLSKPKGD